MNRAACSRLSLLALLIVGVPPACAARDEGPGGFPAGSYQRGDVLVELGADGSTRGSTSQGEEWLRGVYTVDGDLVHLDDHWVAEVYAERSCVGAGAGTYRWDYDREQLSFDLVDDPCATRAGAVVAGPWTRVR